MDAEPESSGAVFLGEALAKMSERLDPEDSKRAEAILRKRIHVEGSPRDLSELCRAWLPILRRSHPAFAEQLPALLEIIQSPKAGPAHELLLKHIEQLDEVRPAKFNGQVFKLVEWLEASEVTERLNLRLDFRPH